MIIQAYHFNLRNMKHSFQSSG